MAFCRKICCCDWSEDRNKTLGQNSDSIEMRNTQSGTQQQQYTPTSNYGRDQRASSLMSNASGGNNSDGSPTMSPRGNLHDPLMSPGSSSSDVLGGTLSGTPGAGGVGGQDLPMSPLVLNHNASFAHKPAGGGGLSPTSFAGSITSANGKKKGITFAPKGFEQPKHTTTSLQGNGQLKGIYKHKSSYGGGAGGGGDGMMMMMMDGGSSTSPGGSMRIASTQQALGSPPYSGADVTGGREPPDLSLL